MKSVFSFLVILIVSVALLLNADRLTAQLISRQANNVLSHFQNVEVVGHLASGSSYAVAVQDNYAYLGVGQSLVVLDISEPTVPKQVGQALLPGIVESIYLDGVYAYIAETDQGLQVFDVSTPTMPTKMGSYSDPK